MVIEVASGVIATLVAEAASAAPAECCGILLGPATGARRIDQAVPAANVAPDPLRHFEIDPQALISAHCAAREGGAPVIGYYHSHPSGHAVPSATDCEHAGGDGSVWAIVAEGAVALWRDAPGGFEALSYRLVDG